LFIIEIANMLFQSLFISSLLTSATAVYLPQVQQKNVGKDSCDCSGDNVRYNASQTKNYICGDKRLGPSRLPKKLPLGTYVTGYDRFGGLSPNEFLGKWWNTTERKDWKGEMSEAGWIYPEKYGFELDEEALPIKANVDLQPGMLVDRFGETTGKSKSATLATRSNTPQDATSLPPLPPSPKGLCTPRTLTLARTRSFPATTTSTG
jgi:hypothetical protein